jgi:hypothetical protein
LRQGLATKLAKWPWIQKKAIAIVWKKILSVNEDIDLFLLVGESVATLLWPGVGVKPNTWKKLGLESFGTPENSEDDLEDQTTSHWGVPGVIGRRRGSGLVFFVKLFFHYWMAREGGQGLGFCWYVERRREGEGVGFFWGWFNSFYLK